MAPRARRPRQLLRSGQPLRLPCSPQHNLWHLGNHLRLSLRRLQLDLCHVPVASWRTARQIWNQTRRPHQHLPLEHRLCSSSHHAKHRRILRRALLAWRRRSPHLPRQRQGHRLLVPFKRAQLRHLPLRRRRQVRLRNRRPAHRHAAAQDRLALEFRRHGPRQLPLLPALLEDLSRPPGRSGTHQRRAHLHRRTGLSSQRRRGTTSLPRVISSGSAKSSAWSSASAPTTTSSISC